MTNNPLVEALREARSFVPGRYPELLAKIDAALASSAPATGEREQIVESDAAWRKFDHWFFRECNAGTRRHLFSAFGLPVDEIRNHGVERHCLRYVRKSLSGTDHRTQSGEMEGGEHG